ncbi:MAG TPA: methyltransferase domain-containing protein [Thermoanaerobaculia bacterium]|nr:methyltransferase domain-containing protein [Thermoanaerobaculia bacterium]
MTQGTRFTRGHGLLEPFLARQRARLANRQIPERLRTGRILDIGCGSFPYFLSHTSFREKYAIDQLPPAAPADSAAPSDIGDIADIAWHTLNLNAAPSLPFAEGHFSAVTLLAVVEHLDPGSLVQLLKEVHRVLAPAGRVIITTPAPWSDGLLHAMARLRLVSAEEIEEHVYVYTHALLGWYFGKADFPMEKIRSGYFELGLNMWATAER